MFPRSRCYERIAADPTAEQDRSPTIASLATEILVEVLRYHVAHSWDNFDPKYSAEAFYQPYTWITVTHVCCFWRSAALQTPDLWTTISVLRPQCVEAFLERSQGNRLCVLVPSEIPGRAVKQCFPLLYAEVHRFQTFILDHTWLELVDDASFPWSRGAASIEVIDIHASRMPQNFPLFNEAASSLTVIRCCSHFATPTLRFLCPRLQVLDFEIEFDSESSRWTEWIRVLKELPLLEELALNKAISPVLQPHNDTPSTSGVSPVALPRLRRLCLVAATSLPDDFVDDVHPFDAIPGEIVLLRHLDFAPNTHVDITVYSPEGTLALVDELDSQLAARLRPQTQLRTHSTGPATIYIGYGSNTLGVSVWHAPLSQKAYPKRLQQRYYHSGRYPSEVVPSLNLDMMGAPSEDDPHELYLRIPRILGGIYSIHAMRTFALDYTFEHECYNSKPVDLLWSLMEQMTNVQTLYLRGYCRVDDFVSHVLTGKPVTTESDESDDTDTADDHRTTPRTHLFPSLKYLCVSICIGQPFPLYERLRAILSKRQVRTPRLEVHICGGAEWHWLEEFPTKETDDCCGYFYTYPID